MTNAQKKIYTIHQNHDFLKSLAKGILNLTNHDLKNLSETEIYVPNKRSANQLKLELLSLAKNNASILPKIRSIGYEDEQSIAINALKGGSKPLEIKKEIPKYRRLFELVRSINDFSHNDFSFSELTFEQSIKLSYSLIELIDDCDKFEISYQDGLKNILSEELSAHKQISMEFLNFIFEDYVSSAESLGMNPIKRRNLITRTLADHYDNHKPKNTVIIAGSTGTLPATKNLIRSITELENGYCILPYIDLDCNEEEWNSIGNDDNELNHQISIKNLLNSLKIQRKDIKFFIDNSTHNPNTIVASRSMLPSKFCQLWKDSKIPKTDINRIEIAELENSLQEANLIAVLIKEAYQQNKSCGLITENKKLILQVNYVLKNLGLSLDDSLGKSYINTEEGKFLINIAEFLSDNFRTSTFIELLKSPLIEFESAEETLHYKNFVNYIEIKIARKHSIKNLKSLIEKLKNTNAEDIEHKNLTNKYILNISNIINKLDNTTNPDYKFTIGIFEEVFLLLTGNDLEGSINEDAYEVIKEIKQGTLSSEFNASNLYDILKNSFRRITIHPLEFSNNKVHVLAPVEARLVHFDRIIIADANLGSFPQKRFSQWLNNKMKKDFGLPPEELDLSLNAHDFSSFLQFDEVFITRSTYNDAEPTSPSPFITRLKGFLDSQNYDSKINEEYLKILSNLESLHHERKEFEKPKPKPSRAARKNNISVTFIEKTIKNPYGYYAKEILNLRKLASLEEPTERRDYGQFVHAAIEEFSNFHNLDESKITRPELNSIFAKHYKEAEQNNLSEPLWLFETTQISPWLCAQEINTAKHSKKIFSETKGTCEIHGLILTGIADRITISKDNKISITDFKTGKTPTKKDVENLISPQLLIEILMAKHNGFMESGLSNEDFDDVKSVIYYSLSLSDNGPNLTEINVIDKEDLIDVIDKELKNFSESLLDEETPFLAYPDSNNLPDYDDYYLLARQEKNSK